MRDSFAPHLESVEVVRGRPGPGGEGTPREREVWDSAIPVDAYENMKQLSEGR